MADRLADLDSMNVIVLSQVGIPVAVRPPFPADYQFTDADRQVLNSAFISGLEDTLNRELKTGEAKDYSDADKQAYAVARANGGGIVAGKTVEPFALNGDDSMSLLEESIDRVRWDHLCFGGRFSGEYNEHKTAEEIKERSKARAAIRAAFDSVPGPMHGKTGFGGGATYGELVLAKSAAVLAARYTPRTRTKKEKSEDIGI